MLRNAARCFGCGQQSLRPSVKQAHSAFNEVQAALNGTIRGHPATGHSASEIKGDQSSSRYTFARGVLDQGSQDYPSVSVKSSRKTFIGEK
jgi:hypothetical protein